MARQLAAVRAGADSLHCGQHNQQAAEPFFRFNAFYRVDKSELIVCPQLGKLLVIADKKRLRETAFAPLGDLSRQ